MSKAVVTSNLKTQFRIPLRVGFTTASLLAVAAAVHAQVLVVAPHPDDEALFASGIVYRARQSGKSVKVVVATNGDCEVAAIGPIRQQESVAAMGVLGLVPEDVIFLGYPDCGLNQLYHNYRSPESVYTSMAGFSSTYASEGLGGTDYHRYTTGAPAPYSGYWLTEDLKTLMRTYRPQDVYVTSAYDAHPDHYVLNFFVGEALLSAIRSDATFQPTLHDAIVHEPCELLCDPTYIWPMPTFTPTVPFPMPPALDMTPLGWSEVESVSVPPPLQSTTAASNPKYQAIARYASQGGPGPWLEAFVKSNEIFWKWELWANLALRATATASSAIAAGAAADRVNDAAVVGSPRVTAASPGKGEWVTNGQLAGAWVQLTWPTPQAVTSVVLHDWPEPAENISGGTLSFSDGSSVAVAALPASGVGLTVSFPAKNVTWLRFTVTAATGSAAGLAEMEVYGPGGPKGGPPPGGNTPPTLVSGPIATPSTITDQSTSVLSVAAVDADGDPLTYVWTTGGGQIQGAGPSVMFVPPAVSSRTVIHIDVSVADGRGGLAAGSVTVTVDTSVTANPLSDLAIDFGAATGLWLARNPAGSAPQWLRLHGVSPSHMAMGDVDGDGRADLVADFPGAGVWIWFNNAGWVQLNAQDVNDITVGDFDGNGHADVALSFQGYGTYVRMNNLTWVKLHHFAAARMAAGNVDNDSGHRDELIADFPGFGVWIWTNHSTWTPLHGANASHIETGDFDGNGITDIVLDFAGGGLWTWMNHATWVQRQALDSLGTSTGNLDGDAGGRSDLVVNVAGAGVWALMNNSTWMRIHPLNPTQMLALDLDANGRADLVLSFPGAGIWLWMNNANWIPLHPQGAEDIAGRLVDGS